MDGLVWAIFRCFETNGLFGSGAFDSELRGQGGFDASYELLF